MHPFTGSEPVGRLSRSDRRAWKAFERETRRELEREQMETLRSMAAEGVAVTALSAPDLPEEFLDTTPVEIIISGRRLRVARMPLRAVAALRDAISTIAAVPLTAVGRYGPYWVLTFRLATEPLVVLADRLTVLPEWGGPGGVLEAV